MKVLSLITTFLTFSMVLSAQDKDGNPPEEIVKYYFVELITNADRPELPKDQVDSIQRAHMAYMARMAEKGQLMLAGPFEGGGGIFVLNVPTREAAEDLAGRDPAVSAGRLFTKIRAWYTGKGAFTSEQKQSELYENIEN